MGAIDSRTGTGQGVEDDLFGQDLGEGDGFGGPSGRIDDVKGDSDAAEFFQGGGDLGVGVGPVGLQGDDAVFLEGSADGRHVDGGAFVKLAGDAPVGGEIEEDRFAFGQEGVEGFLRKGLPIDAAGFLRGRGGAVSL